MRFNYYLQQHLIVEWRDKYIQYDILARLLRALRPTTDSVQTKLIAKRAFALLSLTYPVNMARYDVHKGVSIEIKAHFSQDIIHNHLISDPRTQNSSGPLLFIDDNYIGSDTTHCDIDDDSISTYDEQRSIKTMKIGDLVEKHQNSLEHGHSTHNPDVADHDHHNRTVPNTDQTTGHSEGQCDQIHSNHSTRSHRSSITSSTQPNQHRPTSGDPVTPTKLVSPALSKHQSLLPNMIRPTTLETIDEINEKELEIEQLNHLNSLTPNMQTVQKQQNSLMGIAGLNSISQISTFSRQLRAQRQMKLQQAIPMIHSSLTNQTSLTPAKISQTSSLHKHLPSSGSVKLINAGSNGDVEADDLQSANNNLDQSGTFPLYLDVQNSHNINRPSTSHLSHLSPRPQSAQHSPVDSGDSPFQQKLSNKEITHPSGNAAGDALEPSILFPSTSQHSGREKDDETTKGYLSTLATVASRRKRLTIAEYRQKQEEKLRKLEKKTAMTRELRDSLVGPYESLDIDHFYKTKGNYGTSINKSLNLNLTNTSSQVLQQSTKLRQSLNEHNESKQQKYDLEAEMEERMYEVFKRRYEREKMHKLHQSLNDHDHVGKLHQMKTDFNGKTKEIGEYDGHFGKLSRGFGNVDEQDYGLNIASVALSDDEFSEYADRHELMSLLSSAADHEDQKDESNAKKSFTPGYSSHRIAHIDLPHISRDNKNKKKWTDYLGLSYFTSSAKYDEHGNLIDKSSPLQSQQDMPQRGSIEYLVQSGHAKLHHQTNSFNQQLYNKLLANLEKYGEVTALCRKKKYYETLRELSLYLRKMNRTDLLPTLPHIRSPLDLLSDYYPIELRARQDIEAELAKVPIFHTFLPKDCVKYEVELLFCNAIQSQVEKFNEFTLLLEEYYDAHVFNIASILAQLRFSEYLLQVCLLDPSGSAINIQSFIAMRDKQLDTVRKTINEVYRGVVYLDQYLSLNLIGVAKILKKHDKLSISFPFSRECLLPIIFSTHAAQTTSGIHMKHYLETFFMQVYDDSKAEFAILYRSIVAINTSSTGSSNILLTDQSPTTSGLRTTDEIAPTISIATWVHLGSHAGMMLLLLIANILLYLFYPHVAFESERFDVGFPTFRILGTLVTTCWVWAFVTHFCERARINYQLILQLNPRTYLRPPQVFVISSLLTVILMICFTLFVFTLAIDSDDIMHYYVLYATLLLFPAMLFNPLNVMHRPTRWYMIKNSIYFFLSPFTPATIQTSIIGNYWTSALNRMLYDLGYITCYYSKYPITQLPPPADAIKTCTNIMKTDWWFIPTIPSFFRGMQGLRSAYYTNEWYPYVASALKYLIAIPDAISSYYMKQHKYVLYSVIIYCIFAGLRGIWSWVWDITMDFRICARLQAVSDKYEKLVTHLHETDRDLVFRNLDTSSIEHRLHHFGRQSNAAAVETYYQLQDQTQPYQQSQCQDFEQTSHPTSNPGDREYFNDQLTTSQSFEQSTQYFQQSTSFYREMDTHTTAISSSINEAQMDSNPQAYLSLDSNTQVVGNRLRKPTTCTKFAHFMAYHNNIVHFRPKKLSQKYICCGSYDYSQIPRSVPKYLPQSYSWCGLASWYWFYKLFLIPCKHILRLLYVPIFYIFLFSGALLTCMPCRSTLRHTRFYCKTKYPYMCCGRPKKRQVESVTRKYFQTHKLTSYTFQHEPNFPAWYLSKELRHLYFNHSLGFYFICLLLDFIGRNTFVWQSSPVILTVLGISSEWLSFIIAMVSLLRRGLWTYLRFENEALKLTNKLQAVNLEGELVGHENGRWRRNQPDDEEEVDQPADSSLLGVLQGGGGGGATQQNRQAHAPTNPAPNPLFTSNSQPNQPGLTLDDLGFYGDDLTPAPRPNKLNSNFDEQAETRKGPFDSDDGHDDYDDDQFITTLQPSQLLFPSLDAAMEITKLVTPPLDSMRSNFHQTNQDDDSDDFDEHDIQFIHLVEQNQSQQQPASNNVGMTNRRALLDFTSAQHRAKRNSITDRPIQTRLQYETSTDVDFDLAAQQYHRGSRTRASSITKPPTQDQLQQVNKAGKNQPTFESTSMDFEHKDLNHFESGGYQRLQ